MSDIFINGYSLIDNNKYCSLTGTIAWGDDQNGPKDIRRDQVLSVPFLTFGKLQFPEKLAFSAGSLALANNEFTQESTGICLGIPNGSLSTDLDYLKSTQDGFPSPAIFSATLPSSPIADLAIFHKIKGPDRVYAGGDCPCLDALDSACYFLSSGKAMSMVFIALWEDISTAFALCLSTQYQSKTRLVIDNSPGTKEIKHTEKDLLLELYRNISIKSPVQLSYRQKNHSVNMQLIID
jgi:hypothetical protein